ncbi:MAG: hypothetical protein LBJ92_04880 [Holosporales bacterium]|jgi:hypothetical protein|nr:hypothetical protein [Holosporales bacterium]
MKKLVQIAVVVEMCSSIAMGLPEYAPPLIAGGIGAGVGAAVGIGIGLAGSGTADLEILNLLGAVCPNWVPALVGAPVGAVLGTIASSHQIFDGIPCSLLARGSIICLSTLMGAGVNLQLMKALEINTPLWLQSTVFGVLGGCAGLGLSDRFRKKSAFVSEEC